MPIWFPETSEEGGSCLEVLGEGTKWNGVWSVFSLDMKEMAPGREGVEASFVHVFDQLFGSTPGKRGRFYELGIFVSRHLWNLECWEELLVQFLEEGACFWSD